MRLIKSIFIFLILVSIVNIADARTLTGVKIDYAQYGVTLGERGIGNILYNYTYDDGVYILKAKLGKQLFNFGKLSLYGDGSPIDIKFKTGIRITTSKYVWYNMECLSEEYYQNGVIVRASYGCGGESVKESEYTEERYTVFKNNLVQKQIVMSIFQPEVDRIFMNGAIWFPPQKGTVSITSIPSGATISDSNGVLGNTPISVSQSAGTYDFIASKDGYISETKSVTFIDGIYGGVGSSDSLSYTMVASSTTGTPIYTPTPTPTPLDIVCGDWDFVIYGECVKVPGFGILLSIMSIVCVILITKRKL